METAKQSGTSGEGKTSSGATDEDDETIEGTTRVKKWRAVKKASSITRDDKTWYWFPIMYYTRDRKSVVCST